MKNQVIEVLNEEHGERVIKYFQSLGIDTGNFKGTNTLEKDDRIRYYGVVGGKFGPWAKSSFLDKNVCLPPVEIIELPDIQPYPKVMLVSDFPISMNNFGFKRVVFMEKNGRYLAWYGAETLEEAKETMDITHWKYAEDVDSVLKLTLEEIAERFNVPKVKIVSDIKKEI